MLFALVVCTLTAISFTPTENVERTGIVDRVDDIYVFVNSRPTDEYELLSTANVIFENMTHDNTIKKCVKRAKAKHPKTEGVIVEMDFWSIKVHSIQFKDK
jgi:hypothetical protein